MDVVVTKKTMMDEIRRGVAVPVVLDPVMDRDCEAACRYPKSGAVIRLLRKVDDGGQELDRVD